MSDNKPIHEQTDEELRAQGLPEDFIHYRKFPGYNGYAPPAIVTAVQQEKVEPINTQDPFYANRDDEAVQRVMLMDQILSINQVPENAGPVSIPMTRYTRPLKTPPMNTLSMGVDPAHEQPSVITVTTPSGIPVLLEDGSPFTIEDTREGWTRAMEEVLRRTYVHPVLDKADPEEENPCAAIDFRDIRPRGKSLTTVNTPDGPKFVGNRGRLIGAKDIRKMMERLGECVIPRVSHQPADGSEKKPADADPFGMVALKEEQLKEFYTLVRDPNAVVESLPGAESLKEFPSELSKYLGESEDLKRAKAEIMDGLCANKVLQEEEPTPLIVELKEDTIQ